MAKVTYTKKGDVHTFNTDLSGFEKITIDHTGVPEEQRAGVAKQLLNCAAIACYTAALDAALTARDARYSGIEAESEIELGPNAVGQGRVKHLTLKVTVLDLNKEDEDIFRRCERIMKKGCLVTGSLEEGIEVTYELKAAYKE